MISMEKRIEYSESMLKVWALMLKSKDNVVSIDSVWNGLTRVNHLASEYVKDQYGEAAIFFRGRYFTPDCKILPEPKETAIEKRARIKNERL